jgi:hypothetical protein
MAQREPTSLVLARRSAFDAQVLELGGRELFAQHRMQPFTGVGFGRLARGLCGGVCRIREGAEARSVNDAARERRASSNVVE